MGRAKHPATALIVALLSTDLPPRRVVREARLQGISIGRTTVQRIQSGHVQESASKLAPGETRLVKAVKCPGCGQKMDVAPCRVCAARTLRAREFFGRQRGLLEKYSGRPAAATSRPRFKPGEEPAQRQLSLELDADEQDRLDEIRRRRAD